MKRSPMKLLSAMIIFLLAGGATAVAATGVFNGENLAPLTAQVSAAENGPGTLVLDIYNFALIAGGLLAFGAIVYGAIMYGLSGGNSSLASDAKGQITQALLGLLLLFGAYLVLNIVNPELTNLGLQKPKELPPPTADATNECYPPKHWEQVSGGGKICADSLPDECRTFASCPGQGCCGTGNQCVFENGHNVCKPLPHY